MKGEKRNGAKALKARLDKFKEHSAIITCNKETLQSAQGSR